MFEYRVEKCWVRNAEAVMNRMAADGWRVISVCYNGGVGGVVITFERQN